MQFLILDLGLDHYFSALRFTILVQYSRLLLSISISGKLRNAESLRIPYCHDVVRIVRNAHA